jgi:DNA-directed RNA polymerase specialized sigma24 family protein
MTNHYHLICRTEQPNVSRAMRDLNGGYAQYFNRRHRRSGHLFQGRFNGQVIEEEGYLREACRYVALNPVRAGLVSSPELWPWSAHRALAGIDPESPFLSSDFLRREFLERDLRAARARYVEFVQAAMDLSQAPGEAPFESDARVVGSGKFIACFEERLMTASREVPRRERFLARPSLDAVLAGTPAWAELNQRMLKAHEQYGYTLADIATFIGISHASVSARLSEARSRLSVQQT